MTKIAILTSGGDAPGMNACIRAIVRAAIGEDYEVYVVYDGYKGLVNNRIKKVNHKFVSDIINRGGTILGTARLPEFSEFKVQEKAAKNLKKLGITNLIAIGGDGTFKGALGLSKHGIKVVGVPGTIDNDLNYTDITIGFDTALNTIVDCIDKLRDTSSSHQRCSIVEVMGHNCGDLAIQSGLATGAELVLSSERTLPDNEIIKILRDAKKSGKKHEIVIVSENLLDINKLAERVTKEVGMEARATVLGHLQRGGSPTSYDRTLASLLGAKAVDAVNSKYNACCVGRVHDEIIVMEMKKALAAKRFCDLSMYRTAERIK